jgi:hypothetical protein
MRVWPVLVIPAVAGILVAACGGGDSTIGGGDAGNGMDGTIIVPPPPDGSLGGDTSMHDGHVGGPCPKKTCAQLGYTCGPNGDGCGDMLQCGTCTAPQFCGGGGYSKCGGSMVGPDGSVPNPCVPKTCAQLGFNCGPAGDGCGGLLPNCGTCMAPNICGGAGMPGVCGDNVADSGMQCVNLCQQQVACDGGVTTTITGTVYAPTNPALGYGNPDPLYGALVYVPNSPVQPLPAGIACDVCGAQASGSPLVTFTTGPNGQFTLTNAPCGQNIPLVIQLGKWRRQITIPNVACCQNTALTPDQTRLPRNRNEGDIPLIALATGYIDPIECVLPKIGIDTAEFTNPGGGGRVNLYVTTAGASGGFINAQTPPEDNLWGSQATLNQYDLIVFDCEGAAYPETGAALTNILNYANSGGRIFASHYSYVWLYNNGPWATTAQWQVDQFPPFPDPMPALIDTSFQKGMDFATWLGIVGALSVQNPPTINVSAPRHDANAVNVPPSQRFVYADPNLAPNNPLEFTFNTPVGIDAGTQCGRVLFSDFHVNTDGFSPNQFPTPECTAAPMTPQEKVLEFMLFDLSSCIQQSGPPPPTCTPLTCMQQGFNCGPAGDGCGNLLQCGNCPPGQACGAGGRPGVCAPIDAGSCTPVTCQQLGFNCGPAGNGCGGALNCGTCNPPQTCGGGGTPGQCGGGIQ